MADIKIYDIRTLQRAARRRTTMTTPQGRSLSNNKPIARAHQAMIIPFKTQVRPTVTKTLTRLLHIQDPEKAWDHYYQNFESLPHVTMALEELGFNNPLIDKNGRIRRQALKAISGTFMGLTERKNDREKATALIVNTLSSDHTRAALAMELLKTGMTPPLDDPKWTKMIKKQREWALKNGPSRNLRIKYDNTTKRQNGMFSADEVLKKGYAQCLEFSLLFMSLARAVGIKAGIVIVPEHAYNWVELDGKRYEVDLTELLDLKEYILLLPFLGKALFTKLQMVPASAKRIFGCHHMMQGYNLMRQGRLHDAETALRVAHELDDEFSFKCLISLARKYCSLSGISSIDIDDFIKGSSKDRNTRTINELCREHYSVRLHLAYLCMEKGSHFEDKGELEKAELAYLKAYELYPEEKANEYNVIAIGRKLLEKAGFDDYMYVNVLEDTLSSSDKKKLDNAIRKHPSIRISINWGKRESEE